MPRRRDDPSRKPSVSQTLDEIQRRRFKSYFASLFASAPMTTSGMNRRVRQTDSDVYLQLREIYDVAWIRAAVFGSEQARRLAVTLANAGPFLNFMNSRVISAWF